MASRTWRIDVVFPTCLGPTITWITMSCHQARCLSPLQAAPAPRGLPQAAGQDAQAVLPRYPLGREAPRHRESRRAREVAPAGGGGRGEARARVRGRCQAVARGRRGAAIDRRPGEGNRQARLVARRRGRAQVRPGIRRSRPTVGPAARRVSAGEVPRAPRRSSGVTFRPDSHGRRAGPGSFGASTAAQCPAPVNASSGVTLGSVSSPPSHWP